MTPIFDSKDLPGLVLNSTKVFVVRPRDYGELISRARVDLSQYVANKIVHQQRFFNMQEKDEYYTVRVDMIVLTRDEYLAALQEKFKAGVEHERGYRTNVMFNEW